MLLKNKEKVSNCKSKGEEEEKKKKKNIERKGNTTINVVDNKLGPKKKINLLYKNENFIDNKNNYLNDIDKTLLKTDANCVSYVYKNLNEQNISKNKIKNVSENNKVIQILSLEKKKKKNSKPDNHDESKDIQSIIYNAFINKNLKIPTNNLLETNEKKNNKKKLTLKLKKTNNAGSIGSKNFSDYKQKALNKSKHNLIYERIEKNYIDNFAQSTETGAQSDLIKKDLQYNLLEESQKKKTEKKSVSTQTSLQYDKEEVAYASKIFSKKILNKAYIQITYEQNLKQIKEKNKSININNQKNKQTFSHLIDSQQKNLDVMKEKNKISRFLQIFNKINIFSISRNIINCLMNENVTFVKENDELKKKEELEWLNDVTKNVLKNVVSFLSTEKIVSFITEELIEDSVINFSLFNANEINEINKNLNNEKMDLYEKKKNEREHNNLLLLKE